jgi:acyl-CoA reductase-like NAD-dependent aldehyde dehydrogenase
MTQTKDDVRPFLVGGAWRTSAEVAEVCFPYDDSVSARVAYAQDSDLDDAVMAAVRGFAQTRRLAVYERVEILTRLWALLDAGREAMSEAMVMESGKTLAVARVEVARALQTLLTAAEEAKRLDGDILDLDWTPSSAGHRGFVRRFPMGVVLAITPFNYPLNLLMHKLAPAIATGNALIVKPPEVAPLSTLLLAGWVLEAGYPPEAFSVLPCPGPRAEKLVADPRIALLSFTGSAAVGWSLKGKAGRKRVALELGGNAPAVVHEDADLDLAVAKLVNGSFTNAGQSCISVQRILIHAPIFEAFSARFVEATARLKVGDPRDPATDIGPMLTARAAARAAEWVDEALNGGARVVYRGEADPARPALFPPTVLTDVRPEMRVCAEEVFAPVVTLTPYDTWDEAVALANASDYGLQAGLFTYDVRRIMDAWDRLEVGGVIVNDAPTFRADPMPYGGVKGSGLGREGLRYAMQEMTELKLLVMHNP